MTRRVGTLACLLALPLCVATGQTGAEHLTLEAASVKLSNGAPIGPPNSNGGPGTKYPEWFGTTGTLRSLLSIAYELVNDDAQVSGPAWIDSQAYAVEAKVPPGTTRTQFHGMLQNLLAERFRLVIHHDIIVLSVYELVVAKNGPKLKEARTIPGDVPPTPPAPPGARDRDGFPVLPGPGLISSYGADRVCHLKAREQPIANLLRMLRGPNGADRTIIDKTGLKGKYDFTLYYALEIPGSSATGEAGDPAPTLFDALQQQLGLKLVNAKASFDHIVIDHAEKIPTEN